VPQAVFARERERKIGKGGAREGERERERERESPAVRQEQWENKRGTFMRESGSTSLDRPKSAI
jgi:hypothetical protein